MKIPVWFKSSSGTMALYIPMQPSSNTPMIAFSFLRDFATLLPTFWLAPGILKFASGRTCDASCLILPFFSHLPRPRRK